MKKTIPLIIILLIFIFLSYRYLKVSIDDKKTFIFRNDSKPLIYQKKELELEDPELFEFKDYFTILSNNEYQYKYAFDKENIIVSLNNEKFLFPYRIKEKEKEIVTEYVIKEVYINTTSHNEINNTETVSSTHSTEGIDQSYEYEAEYLNMQNSVLSFEKGTDISMIINAIQASIDTNIRISLDYSCLNPNDEGEYPVYIYSELGNEEMIIKII
ncbi:MAG: hypothetical protein IJH00_01360 [Erysipelotrichaceae bacterium]|nr:hypothetical protein [Erysipelotrichaceae bacterium]